MKKHLTINLLWLAAAILLFCPTDVKAQWFINESFESGTIASPWKIYDVNNDNSKFRAFNKPTHAHTGNYVAFVDCYSNNGNDWLVLPQVAVTAGDALNFFARSWYGTENMEVKLSTTGNNISNFNVTLASVTGIGAAYQEFNYDLTAYAGQNIYLAIRWMQATYGFLVDDIKVGKPLPSDVGTLNVVSPARFTLLGNASKPVVTLKNFGTGELTADFPVTCNIVDNLNNTVYTGQRMYTDAMAAGSTDTLQFPQWTAASEGLYTVQFYTQLAGDVNSLNDTITAPFEVVVHYGTGGPDAMGYRWIDSDEPGGPAYNWTDISTTGTSTITFGVDAFSGDDNFSEAIPLGFSFPFYGIPRTFFHADINGTLLLANNNWVKPYPATGWDNDGNIFNYYTYIPGYTGMPSLISVFWDDLVAVEGTGNVYYQSFGAAPARYTIIQWDKLKFAAGTGGSQTLTFQAILHENGEIIMQYKTVANGQTGGANPHDFGQSATIGLQNDDYTTGLAYLNENVDNGNYIGPVPAGNLLHNEMAIRFYPGEDSQVPLIATSKVWNTFSSSAVFEAVITDMSGLVSDSLYYNYGSGWLAVEHDSINQLNHYHYSVHNIPTGATVQYYFVATDNSVNANRAVMDTLQSELLQYAVLPTAETEVLILTPGNRPGYQDYQNKELPEYTSALTNAGVQFDVYNWTAFNTYDIPLQYKTVFAYANSAGNTPIHDTLSRALMEFLDNGTNQEPKNIFFAGDNLAAAQHGLPNDRYLNRFVLGYLRAGYEVQPNPPIYGGTDGLGGPDTPGYHDGSIIGVANSPIGTNGLEVMVNADSPDVLYRRSCPDWFAPEVSNPEISSNISFKFHDGPISGDAYSKGNTCAVWLDNKIYRSFFISFDISQLAGENDVQTTIDEALEWFNTQIYEVTVEAVPGDAGTVTGGGPYAANTTATVTATAGSIYNFLNWTENGTVVSTNPVYTFTVTANHNLQANFEVASYNLTVAVMPSAGGTVTGAGTYLYGTQVSLEASPATGYDFLNWSANGTVISTEPLIDIVLLSDSSLVAHFQSATVNHEVMVTADPANGGTVSGNGTYAEGSTVTVEAIANDNFKFLFWEENGDTISMLPVYTFNIIADRNLVAKFADVTAADYITLFNNLGITAGPNPTSGIITITHKTSINGAASSVTRIELYNANGNALPRSIFDSSITQNGSTTMQCNITDYPAGMYFVRIVLSNGQSGIIKILKTN